MHNPNKSDYFLFQRIFEEWTAAFNRKDLAKSRALFSKSLTADYQGAPRRKYALIREGFKRVFADKGRKDVYRFDLHDVYRSGDLAEARRARGGIRNMGRPLRGKQPALPPIGRRFVRAAATSHTYGSRVTFTEVRPLTTISMPFW
jgi:SnoaL-like domain